MIRTNYANQKPPLGARIEWGHPFSRGLVFCCLFNEGGGAPFDLVTRKQATITGTPAWSPLGLYDTANSGNYYDFGTHPTWPDGTPMSLVAQVICDLNGAGPVGPVIYGGWLWFISSSTRLVFRADGATTDMDDRRIYSAVGAKDAWVQTWTGTVGSAATECTSWRNGILAPISAQTTGAGAYVPSTNNLRVGQFLGKLESLMIYNRILSQHEAITLYQTPYVMFSRPNQIFFMIEETAGQPYLLRNSLRTGWQRVGRGF